MTEVTMGEIRVQEKRGMGAWPWIIGLVVIALAVWLIAGMNDEEEFASEVGESTEVVAPMDETTTGDEYSDDAEYGNEEAVVEDGVVEE